MNRIDFKQHILPHLVAVLTFLIVVILFFSPIFFENKSLNQHDILQWRGGAQELIDYREKTKEEGLWTNAMFGGMPGYLINVKWDTQLIVGLQTILALGLPHPIWYIFLAFVSYYILLLTFGVRPYLAIGGAIAFGFSSFMIIGLGAGHSARIGAIAFMPLVLAGVHLSYSRWKLLGFALTAAALALHLRINHLQITYYLLLVIIIYSIYRLIVAYKSKTLFNLVKTNLVLFGAAILALGTFMGEFWATYQYSRHSTRGPSELTSTAESTTQGLDRDYAFAYSNGIFEPIVPFIPNFYGGSTVQELEMDSNLAQALRANNLPPAQIAQQVQAVPTYWGDQPSTAPYYAGAIIVFFFVLGILMIDKKHSWWLLAATILGIILSWGHNFDTFNYFMFEYFPGYNKFRSVTFALVISFLCMPLLGLLGLEMLLQQGFTKPNQKKFLLALSITAGFSLLSIIFASFSSFRGAVDSTHLANVPEWFLQAIRADRRSLLQADAARSLILVLAAGAVVYFFLKNKLSGFAVFLLLNVLIIGDLFLLNKRFMGSDKFQRNPVREFFAATEADLFIQQDPDLHYRVYNLQNPFNEARTSFHHSSLGGYHGAKLRRYQDLIENCLSPETNTMINNFQGGNISFEDYGIINMLNARYIKHGDTRNHVLKNEAALGNAWLVSSILPVNSPDEELKTLCQLDKKRVAVIDVSKFPVDKTSFSTTGNITLEEYKPNFLKYRYESNNESFAVFSEIYYPEGWEVTIDGEEASHIRANYVLRAMMLPSGEHTIEFKFVPRVYILGNPIVLVSSIILILVIIASILLFFKYRRDPIGKDDL
ncbi:MAG: YfhO family protein [Bacteroidota bacterium]|nr:YfhO family protein [Bacteroidota bacterium]